MTIQCEPSPNFSKPMKFMTNKNDTDDSLKLFTVN